MTDERITIDDIRRSGHCVRGAKRWFEGHGFDWRAVLREGVSVAALEATGDPLAEDVIARTRARRHG